MMETKKEKKNNSTKKSSSVAHKLHTSLIIISLNTHTYTHGCMCNYDYDDWLEDHLSLGLIHTSICIYTTLHSAYFIVHLSLDLLDCCI